MQKKSRKILNILRLLALFFVLCLVAAFFLFALTVLPQLVPAVDGETGEYRIFTRTQLQELLTPVEETISELFEPEEEDAPADEPEIVGYLVEEELLVLPEVDPEAWYLQMANDAYRLSADFVPDSLVEIENGQQVDERIAEPMTALIQAARDDGYTVYFCSGYRSYETQSLIYENHIASYMAEGYEEEYAAYLTKQSVNAPGASEHQLGLTADLLEYQGQDMEPYIGGSGLMLWLEEHCTEYGFIIRYPENKTGITGVEYEPWHLRYVGTECAQYIMEHDLCLEEFKVLLETYG